MVSIRSGVELPNRTLHLDCNTERAPDEFPPPAPWDATRDGASLLPRASRKMRIPTGDFAGRGRGKRQEGHRQPARAGFGGLPVWGPR